MHVDSSAFIRVKGDEGEGEMFKIDSGVRQGCIMSLWVLNVYSDAVMKEVKMERVRRRRENGDYLASYADDFVLCAEI